MDDVSWIALLTMIVSLVLVTVVSKYFSKRKSNKFEIDRITLWAILCAFRQREYNRLNSLPFTALKFTLKLK